MKNIGYSYNGFTTARLKRFLLTGGKAFTFIAWELNEYNEVTETIQSETTIFGVLHTSTAMMNSSVNETASSKVRSRNSYSIITSWENLVDGYSAGKILSPDMSINLDRVEYKITRVVNLQNWNLIAEVLLEECDEWKH